MNRRAKTDVDSTYALSIANGAGIDFAGIRKAYALKLTTEENKPFSPVMFAMLDGKDIRPVIWKMVKHLTAGHNPMVDAHNT